MQQTFDLSQLRDIHTPAHLAWWPPGLGWWLLLILIGAIFIVSTWKFKRYRQQHIARFALTKLQELQLSSQPSHQKAAALSILLRRVALSYYPRHRVAGLHGTQWLNFLASTSQLPQFTTQLAQALIQTPYQAQTAIELDPLFELATRWIQIITTQREKS